MPITGSTTIHMHHHHRHHHAAVAPNRLQLTAGGEGGGQGAVAAGALLSRSAERHVVAGVYHSRAPASAESTDASTCTHSCPPAACHMLLRGGNTLSALAQVECTWNEHTQPPGKTLCDQRDV